LLKHSFFVGRRVWPSLLAIMTISLHDYIVLDWSPVAAGLVLHHWIVDSVLHTDLLFYLDL
jgi:uncharacterized membrane protein (DUF4010 family)